MKFRPLHDRVVVKRLGEEELTAGGIIIPDTAQEKPMEGKVIAVGPGARSDDGLGHEGDGNARGVKFEAGNGWVGATIRSFA